MYYQSSATVSPCHTSCTVHILVLSMDESPAYDVHLLGLSLDMEAADHGSAIGMNATQEMHVEEYVINAC